LRIHGIMRDTMAERSLKFTGRGGDSGGHRNSMPAAKLLLEQQVAAFVSTKVAHVTNRVRVRSSTTGVVRGSSFFSIFYRIPVMSSI